MNPSDPQHPWQRLAAAARRADDNRATAAPYGFATRVAALGLAQERAPGSLLARFSLRALAVACLLMVGSVAANYSLITSNGADDEVAAPVQDDPVAEMIAVAS